MTLSGVIARPRAAVSRLAPVLLLLAWACGAGEPGDDLLGENVGISVRVTGRTPEVDRLELHAQLSGRPVVLEPEPPPAADRFTLRVPRSPTLR